MKADVLLGVTQELLPGAFDGAYATFGTVPRPARIDYCQCCMSVAEHDALIAVVPLRTMPAAVLAPYASHALMTVGDVADYRYFLPRLLEIGCTGGFGWPDLEPLFGGLARGGYRGWAADERAAVDRLFAAVWHDTLMADGYLDPDTVLCAIGNAAEDLTPFLATWAGALGEPVVAERLARWSERDVRPLAAGWHLTNAFWSGRPAQADQVTAWLTSAGLHGAVTAAYETAIDERHLEALTLVHGLLGPGTGGPASRDSAAAPRS